MSGNIGNVTSRDLSNLAKYATMTAINEEAVNPFDGAGLMAGIGVGSWALSNGKTLIHPTQWKGSGIFLPQKDAWNVYKTNWKNPKALWNAVRQQNALNEVQAYKNSLEQVKKLSKEEIAKLTEKEKIRYQNALKKQGLQKEYNRIVNKAVKKARSANPGDIRQQTKEILKAKRLANYQIHGAKVTGEIKPVQKFGKVTRYIKNKTGLSHLSSGAKYLKTTKAGSMALKCFKGNAAFALIEGGVETFTTVIPTFNELGTSKGMKQLGKSSLKVAGSVGGWAAGAAIGTAICPGAGTLAGALIGLGCSVIGSWLGNKAASAIVGKDELEIAQDKQAQELAEQAANDSDIEEELVAAAAQRLDSEGNELSEDGKIAKDSLERIVANSGTSSNETTAATKIDSNDGIFELLAQLGNYESTTGFNPMMGGTNFTNPMMGGFNPMMGGTNFTNPMMGSMFGFNPFNQSLNMNPLITFRNPFDMAA